MSFYVVGDQETFFSLDEIVYLKVEHTETDDCVCVLGYFFVSFVDVQSLGIGNYAFVPLFNLIVAAT